MSGWICEVFTPAADRAGVYGISGSTLAHEARWLEWGNRTNFFMLISCPLLGVSCSAWYSFLIKRQVLVSWLAGTIEWQRAPVRRLKIEFTFQRGILRAIAWHLTFPGESKLWLV